MSAEKLFWLIGALFMLGVLPSALLGMFPLWLAARRGRFVVGLAAFVACIAVGFAIFNVAVTFSDVFAELTLGAVGGLVTAVALSLLLLRRA